jgi:hypothetical protein
MNPFLLGCILVLAHTAETILGFGATLIALALGIYLFPLQTLVPILVILGLLQSIWLVARWFRYIEWRILWRDILPVSGAGMIIGILSRELASESQLRMVLGAFIVVVSIMELVYLFVKSAGRGELRWYYRIPLLFAGGIFHGLFATGGPLIVYYASRQLKTQESFRATLSTLWLILNTVLLIGFSVSRQVDLSTLKITALVLPGLIIGIILGNFIRVRELLFKVMTYALLLFSGLFLLIQ